MTEPRAVITDSPSPADRAFRQFVRDADYVQTHWGQLRDQYPQEWIAVFEGEVVTHGKTMAEVLILGDHPERAGHTVVCYTGDADPFYQR